MFVSLIQYVIVTFCISGKFFLNCIKKCNGHSNVSGTKQCLVFLLELADRIGTGRNLCVGLRLRVW